MEPEATCSTNMVHSLLQRNIHLQSCNFPFHYATRSSLVKSDGSDQFGFVFFCRYTKTFVMSKMQKRVNLSHKWYVSYFVIIIMIIIIIIISVHFFLTG